MSGPKYTDTPHITLDSMRDNVIVKGVKKAVAYQLLTDLQFSRTTVLDAAIEVCNDIHKLGGDADDCASAIREVKRRLVDVPFPRREGDSQ